MCMTMRKFVRRLYLLIVPQSEEVFYIGQAEVLPPPLEKKDENMCILALGEDAKLSCYTKEQARNELISHNLRLVVYLAKKFENTGVSVEDLISIGSIGLIKGINTFNPCFQACKGIRKRSKISITQ